MGRSGFACIRAIAMLASALAWSASAAPRGPESDAVPALRRVHQALDEGNPERALKRLARLDRDPLADHAALLRARVLHQLGRSDAAIEAARAGLQLDPPRELASLLFESIARVEIDRGRLLDAYKGQQQAWEATGDAARAAGLAYQLAQAFEQSGLPGDALALYRRVWSDWPLVEIASAAFERSEQLTRATGAPAPTAFALLQRAQLLREAYLCPAALPLYEQVLAREAELIASARDDARHGHANCLFATRRYTEAATAFAALAKSPGAPRRLDAALQLARSWARAGDEARALRELDELRAQAPPATRAEIDYLEAVTLRTRQPARHIELLRRIEQQDHAPALAREARWLLAWEDWTGGARERALERLRPLARGALDDVEVQRAQYWVARALQESDPEQSGALLRQIVERQALSYYGFLAADRLGAGPVRARPHVGARPDEPIDRRAARAGWLIDGGFPELARAELVSWLAEPLRRAQRLQAAALLHEVGEHHRALRTVSDGFAAVLEQGIDPEWSEVWELAWPRPYEVEVRAAAAEFGFDPSLVWAVMREESSYRPAVESPAGAIGLMQIIPPTGSRIAAELGVDGFGAESLRIPVTNIRFGTYYLSYLTGRFSGSQPLAVAAYNAGPDAVTRWIESEGPQPDDAFVESVPYGETRRYLRRVLRSQRIYRLLYAEAKSP